MIMALNQFFTYLLYLLTCIMYAGSYSSATWYACI